MIRKKREGEKPVIDLTGPDGNAFALMGYAKKWADQLNMDFTAIQEDMMESDYENLLNVLERNFGDYVIFER